VKQLNTHPSVKHILCGIQLGHMSVLKLIVVWLIVLQSHKQVNLHTGEVIVDGL